MRRSLLLKLKVVFVLASNSFLKHLDSWNGMMDCLFVGRILFYHLIVFSCFRRLFCDKANNVFDTTGYYCDNTSWSSLHTWF